MKCFLGAYWTLVKISKNHKVNPVSDPATADCSSLLCSEFCVTLNSFKRIYVSVYTHTHIPSLVINPHSASNCLTLKLFSTWSQGPHSTCVEVPNWGPQPPVGGGAEPCLCPYCHWLKHSFFFTMADMVFTRNFPKHTKIDLLINGNLLQTPPFLLTNTIPLNFN